MTCYIFFCLLTFSSLSLVDGQVNLAAGKRAYQSSTKYGGVACKAIDGRPYVDWRQGSCTYTRFQRNPWWEVDLLRATWVVTLKITNRGDCCGCRLRNLRITVGSRRRRQGRGNALCAKNVNIPEGKTGSVRCRKPLYGRYVTIQKIGHDVLTLCEVEVFSRCKIETTHPVSIAVVQLSERSAGWAQDSRRAVAYAPLVYFHGKEKFFPSSLSFFLKHVNMITGKGRRFQTHIRWWNIKRGNYGYFLDTKQGLRRASSDNLAFFRGQNPKHGKVHSYAIIRKHGVYTDIIYWHFYPFNKGKRVCLGVQMYRVCLPSSRFCWARWTKCFGVKKRFGNHVGDWEHLTIRFIHNRPRYLYLSAHNFGGLYINQGNTFRRGRHIIHMHGSHPVVYSALGSHGLWPLPADHVYKKLCNGARLIDVTRRGIPWRTWQGLEHAYIRRKNLRRYQGQFRPFNFKGRWGNKERGCGIVKKVAGQCIRNSGPTGPIRKSSMRSLHLSKREPYKEANEVLNGGTDETREERMEDFEEDVEDDEYDRPQKGPLFGRRRFIRRRFIRRRFTRRRFIRIRFKRRRFIRRRFIRRRIGIRRFLRRKLNLITKAAKKYVNKLKKLCKR